MTLKVPLLDIAAYFRESRPDLVKIDVEGAEAPILRRLGELLSNDYSPIVYVEVAWGITSSRWRETMQSLDPFEAFGYKFTTMSESSAIFDTLHTLEDVKQFNQTVDLLLVPQDSSD